MRQTRCVQWIVVRKRHKRGVTLIEALAAMVILAIAALGTLSYQYHSAKHSHITKLEMTATRTAQLLLEDWKSSGGGFGAENVSRGYYGGRKESGGTQDKLLV